MHLQLKKKKCPCGFSVASSLKRDYRRPPLGPAVYLVFESCVGTHSGPWTSLQSRTESWSYWSCWRNWSLRCRYYRSFWEPVSPRVPTGAAALLNCRGKRGSVKRPQWEQDPRAGDTLWLKTTTKCWRKEFKFSKIFLIILFLFKCTFKSLITRFSHKSTALQVPECFISWCREKHKTVQIITDQWRAKITINWREFRFLTLKS